MEVWQPNQPTDKPTRADMRGHKEVAFSKRDDFNKIYYFCVNMTFDRVKLLAKLASLRQLILKLISNPVI